MIKHDYTCNHFSLFRTTAWGGFSECKGKVLLRLVHKETLFSSITNFITATHKYFYPKPQKSQLWVWIYSKEVTWSFSSFPDSSGSSRNDLELYSPIFIWLIQTAENTGTQSLYTQFRRCIAGPCSILLAEIRTFGHVFKGYPVTAHTL